MPAPQKQQYPTSQSTPNQPACRKGIVHVYILHTLHNIFMVFSQSTKTVAKNVDIFDRIEDRKSVV